MGIVSLGRSLIIRQLLLAGLVLAMGAFCYDEVAGLADVSGAAARVDHASFMVLAATTIGCLLILGVSLPLTYLSVVKPVVLIAAAVDRLAAGDFATEFAGEARGDELGRLARSLTSLRDTVSAGTGKAMHDNAQVQDGHVRALATRVEAFAEDLGSSVRRLAAMTRRMTDASKTMIVAAHSANEGSDQATDGLRQRRRRRVLRRHRLRAAPRSPSRRSAARWCSRRRW